MATPSDLISHYSNQAHLTRLAALTFVGAVVGVAWDKLSDPSIQIAVGFTLIIVVGSLAELNRRYTHSYLSACRAAAAPLEIDGPEDRATANRWSQFYEINELPWEHPVWRFVLLWLTYLPGLFLGVFLVGRSRSNEGFWKSPWFWLAFAIALGIVLWSTQFRILRWRNKARSKPSMSGV